MSTKSYKVNFTLFLDVATKLDSYRISDAINQVLLGKDEAMSIVYEPIDELNYEVTALITVGADQTSPARWLVRLISEILPNDSAVTEFKVVEVVGEDIAKTVKLIINTCLRLNAEDRVLTERG